MGREITIKVKLTPDEWIEFRDKCDEAGFSQSSLARWLIRQWVSSDHTFNIGQGRLFNKPDGRKVAQ